MQPCSLSAVWDSESQANEFIAQHYPYDKFDNVYHVAQECEYCHAFHVVVKDKV